MSRSGCHVRHCRRAAATSGRRCSSACTVFFEGESQAIDDPPQCTEGGGRRDRVGIPPLIPSLRYPFPQVHRLPRHGTSGGRGTTAAVLRTRGKRSSVLVALAGPFTAARYVTLSASLVSQLRLGLRSTASRSMTRSTARPAGTGRR